MAQFGKQEYENEKNLLIRPLSYFFHPDHGIWASKLHRKLFNR